MNRAVAAGVAGGVMLWLASPAVGLGWLAWVALVPPAAVAIGGDRLAVPLAYVVALELLLVPALPFGLADGQFGELPAPLFVDGSPLLVVALVLIPLFGLLLWAVHFGHPWLAPLVPAIAWAALDHLRVKFDPGAFWGTLFPTQHELPTASLGALAGPVLISFAIALVAYAIALALVRRTRATAAVAAGVVAAVAVATVAGERLRGDGGRTVTVAAVQPGEHTAADDRFPFERFHPGTYEVAVMDVIADLTPLTEQAADRGARVIAWPEAMSYVDPTRVPPARAELIGLARSTGAAIVVPYFIRAERQGEAVVVSPTGAISPPLPKQRPSWFWDEDSGNRLDPRPVEAAGVSIGTLLGVDNGDPAVAQELADAGAELLVSSTHDWRELAVQQRAFSRVAAAALGTPVLRADWRYGSAVIDADGTDAAAPSTARSRRIVVADVRTRSGSTPYSVVGEWPGWVFVALTVALWIAGRRAAPRARRPARPASPPHP